MNLDDRMKMYEKTYQTDIPRRMPVVMRLDGRHFHTLTRGCEKPFDIKLWQAITGAALELIADAPVRMAYQQSDEISILLVDYNKFDSEQWFGGNIQKMTSLSAATVSVAFSRIYGTPGYFDSRVLAIPERDIDNYFVWRQQDAMRNAVAMAARTVFSQKQLHEKHVDEQKAMMVEKGLKFDDFDANFRFGTVLTPGESMPAPVFEKDRAFIKNFLRVEEE